jgi:hypothetical protein
MKKAHLRRCTGSARSNVRLCENSETFKAVGIGTIFVTKLTTSSLNPFRSCFKVGEQERHLVRRLLFTQSDVLPEYAFARGLCARLASGPF